MVHSAVRLPWDGGGGGEAPVCRPLVQQSFFGENADRTAVGGQAWPDVAHMEVYACDATCTRLRLRLQGKRLSASTTACKHLPLAFCACPCSLFDLSPLLRNMRAQTPHAMPRRLDLALAAQGRGKSTLLRLMARRQIPVPLNIDVLLVEQEIVGDDR